MSNKLIVVWGTVIILLVGTIYFIGVKYEEELKYISLKNELKDTLKEYIKDISNCYQGLEWEELPYSTDFIDKLFGKMVGYQCMIQQDIKDTFYVDTYFGTSFERKMWE